MRAPWLGSIQKAVITMQGGQIRCAIQGNEMSNRCCSAATVEEAHDRMLHPERYEKTEAVLTLTPSGDTEFNTAQPAGSTAASLTDADQGPSQVDAPGQVAPAQASEELWDDSFKPPSTLQRSNSPTSTLANRFASAGAILSDS